LLDIININIKGIKEKKKVTEAIAPSLPYVAPPLHGILNPNQHNINLKKTGELNWRSCQVLLLLVYNCMGNEGRGEIKGTALPYGDRTGKVIRLVPSFLCKDNRERARQREESLARRTVFEPLVLKGGGSCFFSVKKLFL
jgi:hypothetical protein